MSRLVPTMMKKGPRDNTTEEGGDKGFDLLGFEIVAITQWLSIIAFVTLLYNG